MKLLDVLRRLSPLAASTSPTPAGAGREELSLDAIGALDVLDNLPIAVFIVHYDGRMFYTNPAFAQLLGYPGPSDFPTHIIDVYFDPRDRPEVRARIETEGSFQGHSLRLRRADGAQVWAEISLRTIYDAAGKPRYLECTAIDITDRLQTAAALEQASVALRQSEARYLGLFENSPVALWEEDFSAVKAYIDRLRREGVTDFKAYFEAHPQAVDDCLALVRVDDVNLTTLSFYNAASKSELLAALPRILGPETRFIFHEELLTIAAGGTTFESEGQNRTLDGDVIDIYLRWAVAPGYEQTYAKVFVSTIDITERKRAEREERLRAQRAAALARLSRSILEAGLDPEAVYDAVVGQVAQLLGDACAIGLLNETKSVTVIAFRHTNPNTQRRMLEAFPEWPAGQGGEILGKDVLADVVASGESMLIPEIGGDRLDQLAPHDQSTFAQIFPLSSVIVAPLGRPGLVIGALIAMRAHPSPPFNEEDLAFINDLAGFTALTILNAQLHDLVRRQAQMDALTGIYNRSYFIRLAEIEFERARRYNHALSAVMLDLDHFKKINDTYGHAAGDAVLTGVIERCFAAIRAFDLLGRYGGEEFMVLMPETDLDGAFAVAERVRQCVGGRPFEFEDQSIRVTVSLGVASLNDMTTNLAALLAQADTALYAAKHAGRNRVAR